MSRPAWVANALRWWRRRRERIAVLWCGLVHRHQPRTKIKAWRTVRDLYDEIVVDQRCERCGITNYAVRRISRAEIVQARDPVWILTNARDEMVRELEASWAK